MYERLLFKTDAHVITTILKLDPDIASYSTLASSLFTSLADSNFTEFLSSCPQVFSSGSTPVKLSILSTFPTFAISPVLHAPLISSITTITSHLNLHTEPSIMVRYLTTLTRLSSYFTLPLSTLDYTLSIAFSDTGIDNSLRVCARDSLIEITKNSPNLVLKSFSKFSEFPLEIRSVLYNLVVLGVTNGENCCINGDCTNFLLGNIADFFIFRSSHFENLIGCRIVSLRCLCVLKFLLPRAIDLCPVSVISFLNLLVDIISNSKSKILEVLLGEIFEIFGYLSETTNFFPKLCFLEYHPCLPSCFSKILTELLTPQLTTKRDHYSTVVKILENFVHQLDYTNVDFSKTETDSFKTEIFNLFSKISPISDTNKLTEMLSNFESRNNQAHYKSKFHFENLVAWSALTHPLTNIGEIFADPNSKHLSKIFLAQIKDSTTEFWFLLSNFVLLIPNLPGEAQMIDRIFEHFAELVASLSSKLTIGGQLLVKYSNTDNESVSESDKGKILKKIFNDLHYISFASLLLHTDLHNKSVQNKMDLLTFTESIKSEVDCDLIDFDLMEVLYHQILENPIPPVVTGQSPKNSNILTLKSALFHRNIAICQIFNSQVVTFLESSSHYPIDSQYFEALVIDLLMIFSNSKCDCHSTMINFVKILKNFDTFDKAICILYEVVMRTVTVEKVKSRDQSIILSTVSLFIEIINENPNLIVDAWSNVLKILNIAHVTNVMCLYSSEYLEDINEIKKFHQFYENFNKMDNFSLLIENDVCPEFLVRFLFQICFNLQYSRIQKIWPIVHSIFLKYLESVSSGNCQQKFLKFSTNSGNNSSSISLIFHNFSLLLRHILSNFVASSLQDDVSYTFGSAFAKISTDELNLSIVCENFKSLAFIALERNFPRFFTTLCTNIEQIIMSSSRNQTLSNHIVSLIFDLLSAIISSKYSEKFVLPLVNLVSLIPAELFSSDSLVTLSQYSVSSEDVVAKIVALFANICANFEDYSLRKTARDLLLKSFFSQKSLLLCRYSVLLENLINSSFISYSDFLFVCPLLIKPLLCICSSNIDKECVTIALEEFSNYSAILLTCVDQSKLSSAVEIFHQHFVNIQQVCLLILDTSEFNTCCKSLSKFLKK
ncbi:hypothetical protein P9112_012857 [Eukaryota sp. TZLM1-RC]